MIKYETTLEEAKEIKKLGFDFSKACKDLYVDCDFDIEEGFAFGRCIARVAKTDSLNVYRQHIITSFLQPFRWEWGDGEVVDIDDTDLMLNLETKTTIHTDAGEGTIYEIIPIIPYPILEACLPEIEIEDKDNYDKQFSYPNIFETRYWEHSCEDMSETTVIKTFNNPCEAFAWSIKNYPEETRKRFNEVMEMYEGNGND